MLMLQSIFGSLNKFVLRCHHKHAPRCCDTILIKEILVRMSMDLRFLNSVVMFLHKISTKSLIIIKLL